jgi:hypothetical protein
VMATEIARRGEHRLPLSLQSPRWLFAVGLLRIFGGFARVAVGRHGVGSRWVAGLGCRVALSLDQSLPQPSFFQFFFLDLPDLLD